ncbi:MAG TPA: acetate kinase, partial [Burkholderiales bacterium]|nr:acetate kinase [Burkholderiales bacterium]
MSAAIGVLNAGSSSIKFALFLERGAELELHLRGQLEAIYSAPRFTAKRRDGTSVTNAWLEGTKLGHGGALEYLVEFLRSERLGSLEGVGHRIVHGGLDFAQPVLVDAGVAARLEKLVPL